LSLEDMRTWGTRSRDGHLFTIETSGWSLAGCKHSWLWLKSGGNQPGWTASSLPPEGGNTWLSLQWRLMSS
jgi:hypothetical protein